jgi:hypothetical protein
MPSPQEVLSDPNFHALPLGERLKVMRTIDPSFAALPPKEQGRVIYQSAAQLRPSLDEPPAPKDEGFLKTLGKDAMMMVPGAVKAIMDPEEALRNATAARLALRPKAAEELKQGNYLGAAGYGAASMLPFVGPVMAQAGEEIGAGQYRQGAAHTAEILLPLAGKTKVGRALGAGAKTALKEMPGASKVAKVGNAMRDAYRGPQPATASVPPPAPWTTKAPGVGKPAPTSTPVPPPISTATTAPAAIPSVADVVRKTPGFNPENPLHQKAMDAIVKAEERNAGTPVRPLQPPIMATSAEDYTNQALKRITESSKEEIHPGQNANHVGDVSEHKALNVARHLRDTGVSAGEYQKILDAAKQSGDWSEIDKINAEAHMTGKSGKYSGYLPESGYSAVSKARRAERSKYSGTSTSDRILQHLKEYGKFAKQ